MGTGPTVQIDVYAGSMGVVGVQAALMSRMKDGQGRFVDVSMLDCSMSLLSHIITRHEAFQYDEKGGVVPGRGITPHREGPWWYLAAVFDGFECQDGKFIMVVAYQDQDFQAFCTTIGKQEWPKDPRFKSLSLRLKNYHEMQPMLRNVMLTRPRDDWVKILQQSGVSCGPVNSIAEMLEDPQLKARQMISKVWDNTLKQEWTVPGCAVKISGFEDRVHGARIHAHNEDGEQIRSKLTILARM
eukprot:gnl/TRDRNA2_/TRDRNA2_151519_c1_seq1.p1 gnl/TRDRNA2_/TRDRNA2_151519_c1~~gnl/TRDRNA2_/TRDRNA2_151519_c1_seq1.p1  ORF type:complete len:242 (+),score=34.91 gnl/TRDRNA2_/TRDRNA2_151519_c1_seq1:50-775(+)